MALHSSWQANPKCVRGELQRPLARRMPQRNSVHLDGSGPRGAGGLAQRLQCRSATLKTGRAHSRRSRKTSSIGACPDRACYPFTHQAFNRRALSLTGNKLGSTSGSRQLNFKSDVDLDDNLDHSEHFCNFHRPHRTVKEKARDEALRERLSSHPMSVAPVTRCYILQ